MPLYNFECNNEKCQFQFSEQFQTFNEYTELGPPKCPQCSGETTRIYCMINNEKMNVRFKGLPMGDGPSAGISNLRTRYPKGR